MRQYRGLTKDGKMVYGNLIVNNARESDGIHKAKSLRMYIRERNLTWISDKYDKCWKYLTFEVIPETVGRQVGQVDENDKEIYEGDIIKLTHWFVPTSDMYRKRWLTNRPEEVKLPEFYEYILNDNERDIDKENIYEIIGNIHQNPELLEKPL